MFARWPGLFIQPLTIAWGVDSAPDPQPRFSPTTQSLPLMYPVGWTRSTTVLPSGVSWAKKCSLTICWHMPSAAWLSSEFAASVARPASVRSPFTKHRIASLSWARLPSAGVMSRSLHASPAPTPPFLPAPGLRLAFGEIFPAWSSNCCFFAVARPAAPTRPRVPSAETTALDAEEELCLTGAGALAVSVPPLLPPHPATASEPTRIADGTAVLISVWIRCLEPSMPPGLSVIGWALLSVRAHARTYVHFPVLESRSESFFEPNALRPWRPGDAVPPKRREVLVQMGLSEPARHDLHDTRCRYWRQWAVRGNRRSRL